MNRRSAENYCRIQHDNKSIIISICDSFDFDAKVFISNQRIKNNVYDILFLSFDDIQARNDTTWYKKDEGLVLDQLVIEEKTQEECVYQLFTEKDAKKILHFIEKWMDQIDTLIVHCNAGVSRSSGVAAAISKYLYGDDTEYFDSYKYNPNTTVYTVLLEMLVSQGKFGDSMLRKKI